MATDYLCIGQILDLQKYDQIHTKLRDFENKEFYILEISSLKGKNDHEGFLMTIEDLDMNVKKISTYSSAIVHELKDLLISVENENGKFKTKIKCKLEVTPRKGKNGEYRERFKLV